MREGEEEEGSVYERGYMASSRENEIKSISREELCKKGVKVRQLTEGVIDEKRVNDCRLLVVSISITNR